MPLESNNYNTLIKNTIRNNIYNNSYRELLIPLTERKEKDIDDNKNKEIFDLRNSLKNISNIKKDNYIRINKAVSGKNEIRSKNFIKKDKNNKLNSFKKRKKLIEKNLILSSPHGNPSINNTTQNGRLIKRHGIDICNKNKDKEKSINSSAVLVKMRKKNSTDLVNYISNKRNILSFKSNSILSSGKIQYDNKDFNYNKKLLNKNNKNIKK